MARRRNWDTTRRNRLLSETIANSPVYGHLTQEQLYKELTGDEMPLPKKIPKDPITTNGSAAKGEAAPPLAPAEVVESHLRSCTMLITPSQSLKWLEGMVHNRPLRQPDIHRYTESMRQNNWRLNGESIIFDEDGVLIDGQHRLWACIESETPFLSIVVWGVPRDAFLSIDQGRTRTPTDHIVAGRVIQNIKYATHVAAAAGLIWRYRNNALYSGNKRIPPEELVALVRSEPGIHDWVAKIRSHISSSLAGMTSTLAAVIHLGAAGHPEEAAAFVEQWVSGAGLAEGSPVLALRNRALNMKVSHVQWERMALCVTVWNAFIKHRPLTKLMLPRGDEFPQILGASQ